MADDGHLKPLLVGEAPPPRWGRSLMGRDCIALYPLPKGCAGQKLQEMSGLSRTEYLGAFERMNLLEDYPEGGKWSVVTAEYAFRARVEPLLPGRTTLLLGAKVAEAAERVLLVPVWRWAEPILLPHLGAHTMIVMLPHPSGRNRHYNDPVVRAATRHAMRRAAGAQACL